MLRRPWRLNVHIFVDVPDWVWLTQFHRPPFLDRQTVKGPFAVSCTVPLDHGSNPDLADLHLTVGAKDFHRTAWPKCFLPPDGDSIAADITDVFSGADATILAVVVVMAFFAGGETSGEER